MSGGNDLHSAFYDDAGSSERFKFQKSSVSKPSEVLFSTVVENTERHARSRCLAALRRSYVTDNEASHGSLYLSLQFVGILQVILCKMSNFVFGFMYAVNFFKCILTLFI